jgi:transcriptional repressor NrdR
VEEVEILDLRVQKRDGSTESYSKDKLIKGLKYSLHKRPYDPEGFKKLISEVEKQIQIAAKDDTIEAKKIGEIVMQNLKNFDKVAYVRFASVYQEFKDPEEFAAEVEKLNC